MFTKRDDSFKFSRAFTLIEFLIVISIMAVLGAAVLSIFSGGINVYKRVKELGTEEMQALLSLEEVEMDLRNTFVISGINFTGEAKEITFSGRDIILGGLGGVCVTANYRGKGIATKMLKLGLDELRNRDCDIACLNVDLKKQAYGVYEKMGFKLYRLTLAKKL